MKTLLLLVDFQGDFLDRPHLRPARGALVDRAACLLESFRREGRPVLHLRLTVTRERDLRMAHWKRDGRWSCVEGTPGHAAPGPLESTPDETVLHKTGFSAPGLVDAVADRGADTVVVAGVMLHACVRLAVLDLYQAGFRVIVATDAVGSDDPLHAEVTRRYLEARSIDFVPVDRLVARSESGRFAGAEATDPALPGAVASAARFSVEWRNTSFEERASRVVNLGPRLVAEADSLAGRMADDLGKPVRAGRLEVLRTAELIEAVVGRLNRLGKGEADAPAGVRRRPHGVVGVITPWNNPVYLALGKIIPAILCGNTVVWKPAPEATAIARRLLELCRDSGPWPESLVQLVEGDGACARALMEHPGIDAVTITASEAAGVSAVEICGRRHLPLQAELGGNNAAIVWSDADLANAAEQVAAGAFDLAGQRCTANRRVIVDRACRDEFLERLIGRTASLAWGDPLDAATSIGPLVSAANRDRVAAAVDRAVAAGAGVRRPLGTGVPEGADPGRAWYPPTLVECDDPDLEIVREESFGPVLVVQTAADWDEAMALCNGVRQGLAAAVFTGSRERVDAFLDRARAGILKINVSTADAMPTSRVSASTSQNAMSRQP